jgi:hypothetical protein
VLRLLLDEHISPAVALGLRRRQRDLVVCGLVEWDGGALGRDDEIILTDAGRQGFTFVTYDRRTIPPLLKSWAEQGRHHHGIIFIDEKTISPADIGAQVRALSELVRAAKHWDWLDRVCFLNRGSRKA